MNKLIPISYYITANCFYICRFLRYYLWQCAFVPFDATLHKTCTPDKVFFPEHFLSDLELGDQKRDPKETDHSFVQIPPTHYSCSEKAEMAGLQDLPNSDASLDTEVKFLFVLKYLC